MVSTTSSDLLEALAEVRQTDVTRTIHQEPYPAIFPERHELSQVGRAVLITGGGGGVGFAIAKAFVRASATTIIIVGRRAEVLEKARSQLDILAKETGNSTKIITRTCDVTDLVDVDAFWKFLADQGIILDVYVANAAKFTEFKPLLELGTEEVWSQVETNVKSPLYFTEKFAAQAADRQKFVVNVSTASIHELEHSVIRTQPAYTLSKMTGTLLFQLLASDHSHDKMQIVSFHPGVIYNELWSTMGIGPEQLDSGELTGAFAVWAASKEAAFLHGRFVWSSWDVEEMATGDIRKRIDEDYYYLRGSIVGLRMGFSA